MFKDKKIKWKWRFTFFLILKLKNQELSMLYKFNYATRMPTKDHYNKK